MKLTKHHVASRRDGHFFTNRVINVWNSLPGHIVVSPLLPVLNINSVIFTLIRSDWFLHLFPQCCVRAPISAAF